MPVGRIAMEPYGGAGGFEGGMPWASNPVTRPASTSPEPAVASDGGALALIAARPSGLAMTVSAPLRMIMAPDRFAAGMARSCFASETLVDR